MGERRSPLRRLGQVEVEGERPLVPSDRHLPPVLPHDRARREVPQVEQLLERPLRHLGRLGSLGRAPQDICPLGRRLPLLPVAAAALGGLGRHGRRDELLTANANTNDEILHFLTFFPRPLMTRISASKRRTRFSRIGGSRTHSIPDDP